MSTGNRAGTLPHAEPPFDMGQPEQPKRGRRAGCPGCPGKAPPMRGGFAPGPRPTHKGRGISAAPLVRAIGLAAFGSRTCQAYSWPAEAAASCFAESFTFMNFAPALFTFTVTLPLAEAVRTMFSVVQVPPSVSA